MAMPESNLFIIWEIIRAILESEREMMQVSTQNMLLMEQEGWTFGYARE